MAAGDMAAGDMAAGDTAAGDMAAGSTVGGGVATDRQSGDLPQIEALVKVNARLRPGRVPVMCEDESPPACRARLRMARSA